MKRVLSFVLALCLIIGLLPAVAIPHAHAAVTSAKVTIFGTAVSIDYDETTADIPEARYWADDGTNVPKVVTAEDNWNYSFAIIDDIPTVTLRNADYKYSKSVVYGKYDGKFRLAYEGINNVFIPSHSSEGRYFLSFSASTNGISSARRVYITGAENAVLNITGGDDSASMISTSNKVYVEVSGGTLNVEKTTAGGVNPVVSFSYCPVTIKNTTLSVINNTKVTGQRPVIVGGYGSYYFNVDDANIYVESYSTMGICAGVWNVNKTDANGTKIGGVDSPTVFDVTGKSDIKVVNTYSGTHPFAGTGIYAKQVKMTGGNLEAQGTSLGLRLTDATPLNLGSYTAEYKMFTEKDAAAVTEYTATPYFKLMEKVPCAHENTTQTEEITQEPTCGEVGYKQVTVFCHDCVEEVSTYEVAIPATNEHTYDAVTGVCSGCGDVEIPVEGPTWPEDVTFATAEQMANVVVNKVASAGGAVTAHPGGKITYKLSITNNNAEAINVHVEDMIPKGTVLLSGCDYTSGRALYWVVEDIAPGETRIITYNVKPDYTVADIRAAEFDVILENNEAKVMDVTIPATEDIWVLETFNAEDIRKMGMAIDALVTANLTAKNSSKLPMNEIPLLNMIFYVGFSAGPALGTTNVDDVFTMIFEQAGEGGSGSSSGGVEDVVDTASNLLKRVPPHLYGGTAVPAEKDELFRGARATEVTINDLITGDLLFVKNNGETKLYIVDGAHLVYLGETEVIRKIDPATVLPSLPTSEQFVVIRPSINLNITFSLQEGEYYNDADREGYTEVEKAIIATAEAYLLRGDRTQYTDDMTGTSRYRWETGTKQPEDYTVDQYGYTNCAAFTYDANYMTTGYAAKNDNNTLNTTANNAAFAKKCWDFETGTSSNAGVVFYAEPMVKDDSGAWVETLDDAGKAAIKEQIISLLRPGDIINIRRTTGSGHAMLYVGNGTIIHSSGSSYSSDNKTDTHEASIRFRMVEDLFDPEIYATTSCVYYLASFSLLRPSAMTTNGATEHALNRMNNMQGIIGEKISSTAMGKTVNCGDEITYTFYVFNTNNEDKVITITDELSEYVTFVSATDNAVVDGSNISWNVTVPADTRVAISYTVKVNEGLAQYTAIDASKATINGVAHKCFDTYVANTLTATEQQKVVDAVNKVKEMDVTGLSGVQIAELIYKEAFGIEHIFGGKITTMKELVNGDTDNSSSTKGIDNLGIFNDTWYWESSNKTSVSWMPNYNTSAAAQMVAPGLYGGQLVYQSSYNKNNRDERSNRYLDMVDGVNRSRYFWEKDLVVGDLFMMATLSSQRSLYIYVGNDTFVSIGEGHTVFSTQSVSARFEYAPAFTWKFLAVMRPSFVFEEAHNVVDIPAVETSCAAAGTTAGKECADCGVHLVEPLTVEALAHTEEVVAGYAATCTETGLTEGKKCTVCGEITVAQEEIPALGHTEEEVPAVDATCTETGLTAGVKCSVCDEILVAQEKIEALGHTEAEAVVENFKDSDLNNEGSYDSVIYCSVCKAELKRDTIKIPVEEGAVAEVGGLKYATLDEALEKAEVGQTVTLLDDVTTNSFVQINKEITLDLGGKTITRNDTRGAATTLYITAAATVKNGTIAATGNGIAVYVDANATIDGVTVKGADVGLYANAAVTTVKNSAISASVVSASESGDGIRAYNGAAVVLAEGTTVSGSSSGSAVEVYAGAAVTVEAGAKIAENNIVYGGTLTVNGTAGAISTSNEMASGITDGYIAAANIVVGEGATVGQITLNTEDATVTGAEDLYVVATLGDKVWYTEGKYVVHTHTEEEIPAVEATCTETGLTAGVKCSVCGEILTAQEEIAANGHTEEIVAGKAATCTEAGLTEGKKCSVCGEILTAQEEIPAIGHSYADDTATECSVCGAVRATVTVVDDEVTVNTNGMTGVKVHVFNITEKEIADINVWNDLKVVDPDFKTYTKNPFELENGTYVLRVQYDDADGVMQAVSYQVTIDYTPAAVTPPTIEVNGNVVSVNTNGLTGVVVHAFNVTGKEIADIDVWNDLKTADPNFKTYTKNAFVLENGSYVLRVQYSNAGGDVYTESHAVTVDYTPVDPTATGSGKTVTVSGATVKKVHVFYVEGQEIADIDDWYQLKAADSAFKSYKKKQFAVENSGEYVLRIEYVDEHGVARKASQKITVS